MELDDDAMTKAIIGTIGAVDPYLLPDSKGYTALMRYIMDVSDEERQKRRDEILGTTIQDFRNFADALACIKTDAARVAVVTSKATLDKAHATNPAYFSKLTSVM